MSRRPRFDRSLLVLLFFGSGCAALIYEVVWFQLLQQVIGSSAVSLGVLLGMYMGGMCLGSVLLPRLIGRRRHPFRVYAALELTIGAIGLVLPIAMPVVGAIYVGLVGGSVVVRIIIAAVCLLPPTMAMGATLPAIARWVETSPVGMSSLGFFYAGNLAGAVVGTLFAGFYLLRIFDVAVASYAAAAINAAVAAAALVIASRTEAGAPASALAAPVESAEEPALVYVTIALSGLTALGAEVIWTRVLSLAFGATVYTFSLIVAAFLMGIGAGSSLGSVLLRRLGVRPRVALGWCQVLLCAAIAWAAYLLTRSIPYWPVNEAVRGDPWLTFRLDLFRSLIVVAPGAILWGASFPLALGSLAPRSHDAGRLVGGVYAANSAGAIVGALGTSLLLAGSVGSQHVQQMLIGIAAVSGVIALMPVAAQGSSGQGGSRAAPTGTASAGITRQSSSWVWPAQWLGVCAAVGLLVPTVSPIPGVLIAYGRRSAEWSETSRVADAGSIVYAGEGVNDFIAVSRGAGGELNYHAAGKVQASTLPEDMRLQLLLAHLSHLVPRHPGRVLVIGCGAGITAGALSTGPGVERITIAEIEPLVPKVAAEYFGEDNHQVISDPRVSVRIDDGRHFLATTNETFDVITTDLIDPWVKGVASLFTREFFELAKKHLRPGGVVTQFVQLYQSSPAAVKSEIGTFVEAFPDAIIWGNPHEGQGYDLVLLGQLEPIRIDVDEMQARLVSSPYARTLQSLRRIGITSAVDLLSTYAGSGSDLEPWLKDAAINRDRSLRLQYLAGLGMNLDENGPIYREMLQYARFPSAVFMGSPATVQALARAVDGARLR